MPRRPSFDPVETPKGWMVSIPGDMAAGGKRIRRFFALARDAEKYAANTRKKYHLGERAGAVSRSLAQDAQAAEELLAPYNVSIVEAARAYVAALDTVGSADTFRTRYDAAVLANEGRWSDRYRSEMEARLPRWVGKEFMNLRLAQITPALIRRALTDHGAKAQSTLDARGRYVSAIMGYEPRHRRAGTIHIMTVRQCAGMLRGAETPAERMAVALLLWAGIRPSAEDGEIARLQWDAVGKSEIYVSSEVAKTNTDRHIPISPRLARLIAGHPETGPVVPANWRRVYRRLRGAAGLSGEQDITRHTFASHHLAAYGEKAAKSAMGHTEGSSTLFRHYRRAVTDAAGLKFFGAVGA